MKKFRTVSSACFQVRRWGTVALALVPPLAGLPGVIQFPHDGQVVGMWVMNVLLSLLIAGVFYWRFTRLSRGSHE